MEKGPEGIRLGPWRPVGVWVKDASGFDGKEVEMSVGNALKVVGFEGEKREGYG